MSTRLPTRNAQAPACPFGAITQVGSEVRGNNTAAGADGKERAFVFRYPYTSAAELWFKVTVVVGSTRSDASVITTRSAVVGECDRLFCGRQVGCGWVFWAGLRHSFGFGALPWHEGRKHGCCNVQACARSCSACNM